MIIFDKELERVFFFCLAGGYKQERFKDGTCGTTLPVFFLLCCLGKINTGDMNEAERSLPLQSNQSQQMCV